LSNGTLLNLTGRSVQTDFAGMNSGILTQNGSTFYGNSLLESAVVVSFPRGEREVFHGYTLTAVNFPATQNIPYQHVLLNVTYHPLVVDPWFTKDIRPQAGVLLEFHKQRTEVLREHRLRRGSQMPCCKGLQKGRCPKAHQSRLSGLFPVWVNSPSGIAPYSRGGSLPIDYTLFDPIAVKALKS